MTVIAAMSEDGGAVLVTDSAIQQRDRIKSGACKIQVIGNSFAVAMSGETFVEYILGRIGWPAEIDEHVICGHLRSALDEHGYGSRVDDDGRGSACYGCSGVILSGSGQIFEVPSNLIPEGIPSGWPAAFGAGAEYALGSMWAFSDREAEESAIMGASAACAFSLSCRGPLWVSRSADLNPHLVQLPPFQELVRA